MAVVQVLSTDSIDQWRSKTNDISTNLGDVDSLTTTSQTVIGAINELDGEQGELTGLVTANKSNLVAAVNEIKTDFDNLSGATALTRAALIAFA
jgi:hypothetical protein